MSPLRLRSPGARTQPLSTYLVEDNPGDAELVRLALVGRGSAISVVVANHAVRVRVPQKGAPVRQQPAAGPDRARSRAAGVVLSSSSATSDQVLCERLGACASVTKPGEWPGYLALANRLMPAVMAGCLQRD